MPGRPRAEPASEPSGPDCSRPVKGARVQDYEGERLHQAPGLGDASPKVESASLYMRPSAVVVVCTHVFIFTNIQIYIGVGVGYFWGF